MPLPVPGKSEVECFSPPHSDLCLLHFIVSSVIFENPRIRWLSPVLGSVRALKWREKSVECVAGTF